MFLKQLMSVALIGGVAVFGVSNYAQKTASIDALAKANNFTKTETAALHECIKQTSDVEIKSWKYNGRTMSSFRVPDSLCVCQSPAMAEVYTGSGIGTHKQLLSALINGGKPPVVEARHFRAKYKSSPQRGLTKIITNLAKCAKIERRKREKIFRSTVG